MEDTRNTHTHIQDEIHLLANWGEYKPHSWPVWRWENIKIEL